MKFFKTNTYFLLNYFQRAFPMEVPNGSDGDVTYFDLFLSAIFTGQHRTQASYYKCSKKGMYTKNFNFDI